MKTLFSNTQARNIVHALCSIFVVVAFVACGAPDQDPTEDEAVTEEALTGQCRVGDVQKRAVGCCGPRQFQYAYFLCREIYAGRGYWSENGPRRCVTVGRTCGQP
jgi:hypothetical protein